MIEENLFDHLSGSIIRIQKLKELNEFRFQHCM